MDVVLTGTTVKVVNDVSDTVNLAEERPYRMYAIKEEVEIEYEGRADVNATDPISIKRELDDSICSTTSIDTLRNTQLDIDIEHPDIKRECLEATATHAEQTNSKSSLISTKRKNARLRSCTECDYTTGHVASLKRHALIHSNEKPFSCSICDYTCREYSNLKRHALIHSNGRPYSCSDCDYTCRQLGNLERHALVHSDSKSYSCNQCQYSCKDFYRLKTHRLIHSDAKPHCCNECSYACKRLSSLKEHMLVHSSEKPFACSDCDYTCRRLNNLKQHSLIHSSSNLTFNL